MDIEERIILETRLAFQELIDVHLAERKKLKEEEDEDEDEDEDDLEESKKGGKVSKSRKKLKEEDDEDEDDEDDEDDDEDDEDDEDGESKKKTIEEVFDDETKETIQQVFNASKAIAAAVFSIATYRVAIDYQVNKYMKEHDVDIQRDLKRLERLVKTVNSNRDVKAIYDTIDNLNGRLAKLDNIRASERAKDDNGFWDKRTLAEVDKTIKDLRKYLANVEKAINDAV